MVKEVSCTIIQIAWAPVDDVFDNYFLEIRPLSDDIGEIELVPRTSTTAFTFTGLIPGEAYYITLRLGANEQVIQDKIQITCEYTCMLCGFI